jgi:hypothetical protein
MWCNDGRGGAMGSVEDVRKVIQDLVAPDLKSLNVRLDSLEKEIGLKFDAVDSRFKAAETLAALRHETVLNTIAARTSQILNALALDKRMSNLKSKQLAGSEQHA